jgi:hypothetical protein
MLPLLPLLPPLIQQQRGSSHGSDTQTTEHTDACSTLIRAPFKPIMSARLAANPLGKWWIIQRK